jgi:hypothetical protein
LRASLWGKQDDTATVVSQTLGLDPGSEYQLSYRYRVTLPEGANPVTWQVGHVLSPPLSRGDWHEGQWRFTADKTARELRLTTHRLPGTHRASGEVELEWVRLERAP